MNVLNPSGELTKLRNRVRYKVNSTLEVAMMIFSFVILSLQLWLIISGEKAIKACGRWCDTGTRIDEWRAAHPGLDIGCYKRGRELVEDHIQAYLDNIRVNSFLERNDKYLDFLRSLLNPAPR